LSWWQQQKMRRQWRRFCGVVTARACSIMRRCASLMASGGWDGSEFGCLCGGLGVKRCTQYLMCAHPDRATLCWLLSLHRCCCFCCCCRFGLGAEVVSAPAASMRFSTLNLTSLSAAAAAALLLPQVWPRRRGGHQHQPHSCSRPSGCRGPADQQVGHAGQRTGGG
jgi:hypothetical protein